MAWKIKLYPSFSEYNRIKYLVPNPSWLLTALIFCNSCVSGLRRGASEEDIQKCLQLDLDEDIPMNDLSVNSNLDEFEEKNNQLEEKKQELEQQYSELIQNGGDIEKANNLLKQCYEIELEQAEVMLQKYTKEYEQAVKEGDTSNADALKGYIKMHEEMKKETEQKLMNYK